MPFAHPSAPSLRAEGEANPEEPGHCRDCFVGNAPRNDAGCASDDGCYSALMLAARITLPHFSVSSATNFPNSAGEATNGVASASASRALMFGSARPALISLFSLLMMSTGVCLGALTPNHELIS